MISATVSSTAKTSAQMADEVIENIYYPPLWWFVPPKEENPSDCGTEPGN